MKLKHSKQIAVIALFCSLGAGSALALQGGAGGQAGNSTTPSNQTRQNEVVNSQGAILTISPATVRAIQQSLNSAGYGTGGVNGSWNNNTATALRRYQSAQGLEPTGRINLRTLAALGISPGNPSGGMNNAGAGSSAAGGNNGNFGTGGNMSGGANSNSRGNIGGNKGP